MGAGLGPVGVLSSRPVRVAFCGRMGFLIHSGTKTVRSEECPLLLLGLMFMNLSEKEGEGNSATPPLEPIRS